MVFPVVLGSGKRLFADGDGLTHFELVESQQLERRELLTLRRKEG